MIHIVPFGKTFKTVEKLKNSLKIDTIPGEEELNKQLNKGNDIYGYVSPYDNEINNQITFCWGLNREQMMDAYWSSSEEI